jgi:hypothetical protein
MEQESGYINRTFTITGISDELCQYLEKIGIARRIYPQMMDCNGIENERQVDTDNNYPTRTRSTTGD